jgi:hypothetical protein
MGNRQVRKVEQRFVNVNERIRREAEADEQEAYKQAFYDRMAYNEMERRRRNREYALEPSSATITVRRRSRSRKAKAKPEVFVYPSANLPSPYSQSMGIAQLYPSYSYRNSRPPQGFVKQRMALFQ